MRCLLDYLGELVRSLYFYFALIPALVSVAVFYFGLEVNRVTFLYTPQLLVSLFVVFFLLANFSIYKNMRLKLEAVPHSFAIKNSRTEIKLDPSKKGVLVTTTFTIQNNSKGKATDFKWMSKLKSGDKVKQDELQVPDDWQPTELRNFQVVFLIPLNPMQFETIARNINIPVAQIMEAIEKIVQNPVHLDIQMNYTTIAGTKETTSKHLKFDYSSSSWIIPVP